LKHRGPMNLGGCVATALAILATGAAGQDPPDRQPPENEAVARLEALVVAATRSPAEAGDLPVNVTVITSRELRLSAAETLQDALLEIPGVNFRFPFNPAVAHPSWQAITLRGLGGNAASRTLVIVDGVPINDPYFGWVRWSQAPVSLIERVEIVRGGGSVTWGGQSLAGVIHIVTRDPDTAELMASVEAGHLGMYRVDATATFSEGRLSGYAGGELFGSDGYVLTHPDLRGDVDIPSASQHAVLRGRVTYDAGGGIRLQAGASLFDQKKDNATPLRENATEISQGQVGASWRGSGGASLSFSGFHQVQEYDNAFSTVFEGRNDEQPSITQVVPSSATGAGLVWTPGVAGLTAGADFLASDGEASEEYLHDKNRFTRSRVTGGQQTLAGVFAQARTSTPGGVDLAAGVRIDRWTNSGGYRRVGDLVSDETLSDTTYADRDGLVPSVNAGFTAPLGQGAAVRGAAYTGLRVATLNELYKPFRAAGGVVTEAQAGLEPERLTGWELGVDYLAPGGVVLRVTAFWARVRDAIADATIATAEESGVIAPCGFVAAGGVCRQRDNIGVLRSVGVESELSYQLGAWFVSGSHSFNPTKFVDGPDHIVNNRAPGSPVHRLSVRAAWAGSEQTDVSVTARYLGDRYDDDLNSGVAAGSFTMDLRLRRDITDRLAAFASVINLLDATSEMSHDAAGFIRIGSPRTVSGGLRVRLGS